MLVSLKASRLSSIAHSPPRTSSTVSSAGGGEMNGTGEENDKERARIRRNVEKGKVAKKLVAYSSVCLYKHVTVSDKALKQQPRETDS